MAGAERPTVGPSLTRVYLLLVLATLLWGGGPVAGKLGLRGIPPITMGLLRFALAATVLTVMHWRRLPAWRSLSRHDLRMLLGLGLCGAYLNHVLFFVGLRFAPASHGALIAPATVPIWTMLLATRAGGERVTRAQALGLLAFFWWNLAILRIGAGRTAVFTNLVPIFGVLLARLILGEHLTGSQTLGAVLALAGVWLCQGTGSLRAAGRPRFVWRRRAKTRNPGAGAR